MDPLTSNTTAEWEFLNEIYALLANGGALNTEQSQPIVRFQHPDELKVSHQTLHCAFFVRKVILLITTAYTRCR